jgi:hypothetical protein
MNETLEDLMARRRPGRRAASGERYIYLTEDGGPGYRVRMRNGNKRIDLGIYDRLEDAIAVRDAAVKRLNPVVRPTD